MAASITVLTPSTFTSFLMTLLTSKTIGAIGYAIGPAPATGRF